MGAHYREIRCKAILIATALAATVAVSGAHAGTSYQMRVPILGVPVSQSSSAAFCAQLAAMGLYAATNQYELSTVTYFAQTTAPYYAQYQGAPLKVTIPSGTVCVRAKVHGAAGSTPYSSTGYPGSSVVGYFPVSSTLEVIIGKGGAYGGSGGLSGVFSGAPSASTAILIAGGGAGADCTTATPGYASGSGYGGAYPGCTGTPFGDGAAASFCAALDTGEQGGYGGGSSYFCPGGSGLPGGASANASAGKDFAAHLVAGYADFPGGGANGSTGGIGQNGWVTLDFFHQ